MLKFVSYSGKWPILCHGVLVIEKNGKKYALENILNTGGSCGFSRDFLESYIETGDWEINKADLPKELRGDYEELLRLVNENVDHGCCGGCL